MDPDGNIPLLAILIPIAVGAAAGAISTLIADYLTNSWGVQEGLSSGTTYAANTIGGAFSGLVSIAIPFPPVIGAIYGLTSNTAEQLLDMKFRGHESFNVLELIGTTIQSALLSLIPLKVKGITKGVSFKSAYQGVLTKIERGIARRISLLTISKGLTAEVFEDLSGTIVESIYDAGKSLLSFK